MDKQVMMERAESHNFSKPDEVRKFKNGYVEIVNIGGSTIGRSVFEPGWRWSTSVKPIVNTHSCEVAHTLYQVSGILKVKMDDGTEIECRPGEVAVIPPGHDAWVVGNETCISIDFQGMADYAKEH